MCGSSGMKLEHLNGTMMAHYLTINRVKPLFDSLKQTGSSIDDDELITYTLNGLGLEFKYLATTLHMHPDLEFDQFYDLVLKEKHLQKRLNLTTTSRVSMVANQNQNTFPYHGGKWGHGRGTRGHGQRFPPSSYHPSTWNWSCPPYNQPPPSLSDVYLPFFSHRWLLLHARIQFILGVTKMGHIARYCRNHGPQTFVAPHASFPTTVQNSTWCFNSRATHHITPNLYGILVSRSYTGTDTIVAGNGNELKITHIGNVKLTKSQKLLNLNEVLCIPVIQKRN
ncbi:uncharacterized protein LOC111371830 [Olea europaea var. sylvestris]|uniref:uncharacterized protein LOC111371830 n=1 Tax=Olea europaea var. sylvestris TaxID=158386 RepID=UPI000C1CD84C|nr:uncharacterized protein LOC111371830 [Olea europaea var. sylvestris]